jgi:hypothetical protein
MAKLIDDPKVVELVAKEVVKGVKAERARAVKVVNTYLADAVATARETGERVLVKPLGDAKKALMESLKDAPFS